MREIYLDNAASTPVDQRVLNAYNEASQTFFGNPSNIKHKSGVQASNAVEAARSKIGELLGLDPRGIIFTSGATEANNLALKGIACLQKKRCSVLISSIEHACVNDSANSLIERGIRVKKIATMANGQINLSSMSKLASNSNQLKLVSTILVNNETGVIQPLPKIIGIAKAHGALVHTDAVQAIGKVPLDILRYADLVSISGHKIGGPKGIGLLWVRPGLKIYPLLVGGGQERGARSGTLPVPLIVAFSKAIEIATKQTSWLGMVNKEMRLLENRILQEVPGAVINGGSSPRVAHISNISFPFKAQIIDHLPGIAASSGAACSCPKKQPSAVLLSMGAPSSMAKNCLRLSAGRDTTQQQIRSAATLIVDAAKKLA